ncbi:hypothetical protein [Sutcliffiella cohnii]|uniref:hypothetical protein n=1 Tax=Sutcliffiella cohnii TaxID=33932 RepID=UPI002E1B9A20|nr:hypothetical protein [Sutcliffiella cohnii]
MSVLQWLSNDEYKQREISKFIVEGAVLQFISSFIMIILYLNTNIEPLFLLLAPFLVFLFYTFLRYVLSGIEYANVFSESEIKTAKRRNLTRSLSFFITMMIASLIVGRPIFDSVMVSLIASFLLFLVDTTSLRKSIKKNVEL